ncbi:MAG: hypothetical protein AVDCRST_MAG27-4186, partial [uncultured Craurococcus sp.]
AAAVRPGKDPDSAATGSPGAWGAHPTDPGGECDVVRSFRHSRPQRRHDAGALGCRHPPPHGAGRDPAWGGADARRRGAGRGL